MNEPLKNFKKKNSIIGKRNLRVDALSKIEGRAIFTDDLKFPGMLIGKLKRATIAHGTIQSLNIDKAKSMQGVQAVITGEDLPNKYGMLPVTQDETALVTDRIRYAGEPLVAVCALDERTAEKACQAVEVQYESLLPIVSIPSAIEGKEVLHTSKRFKGNAHRLVSLNFTDEDANFETSEFIYEDTFYYAGNTHAPMEPHSTISYFENGKLTITSSHQGPYYLKQIVSKVLGLEMKDVRVIVPYVGGGFGGKLDPFPEIICSAKLSMITGRPVKITLSREEVFYNHRGRHPALMSIKTGIKDGKLQALHLKCLIDGGAYGSFGAASTYYHIALNTTTYQIPSYQAQAVRFYTNKAPCGPKRGHGTPQPRFALECHLDKIAEKLKINPVELRLQNLIEPYSITSNHIRITSCALKECIQKVDKASKFSQKWQTLPFGEGLGFAVGCYVTGAALPIYWNNMAHTEVIIKADRSGTISAYSGHTEIGQGSDTVLAYIVGEVLGIPPEDVHLVLRDSDIVPPDLGSYSSRVTLMMGRAAMDGAKKLKKTLLEIASKEWNEPIKNLYLEDSFLKNKTNPDQFMTFSELTFLATAKSDSPLVFSGNYRPEVVVGDYKGAGVGPSPTYSFSASVIHTKIDLETGLVIPKKVWLAHDIGKAINPNAVEGQIEGSVHMALGEVLFEENSYTKNGLQKNLDFLDYKIINSLDMPEVESYLVESEDFDGPFGAKEVGQGPLLPVIPALANAVYDAIGVRFDEIPITPDKVLKALERKQSRVGPKNFPEFTFPDPISVKGGGYVSFT